MMSIPVMKTFTENLNQLCIDLQEAVRASDHPSVDKKVQLSAESLEQFLLTQHFTPIQENTLLKLDSIAQLVPHTRAAYEYYHQDLERSFATDFSNQQENELDLSPVHLRREAFISSKEAHFSNIQEKDRVLVVGSSYFPLQSIILAGQFNAHVVCVEPQQSIREHAQRVVEALDLQSKISIQDIKNIYLQAPKAHALFISRPIGEKAPLINSLTSHLKPGTRVMCRTGYGLRAILHEFVPHKQIQGYTQIGLIETGKSSLQSSLCLLR